MTGDRLVVSSTNKTDCHDITETLLKVVLNTIPPPPLSTHAQILKNNILLMFSSVMAVEVVFENLFSSSNKTYRHYINI